MRGTPTPRAQVQTNVQAAQAQAEAGLRSITGAGVLNPQELAGLTAGVRRDFERLARVLNVELAGAQQAEAQAKRVNETSARASTAQERADRNREQRAQAEAARVGAAAAATRAPISREERVARAAETQLIQREGRRQAAAEDARRLASNEGGALDTKLAAAADRERVRQAERAVVLAAREEAQTQEEIVEAARLQLVARREAAGAVARTIRGRPGDVDTLTTANVETRGLRDTVRGETVVREAAALEDGDPRRLAQARLRQEELAQQAVRRAEEAAGADRLILSHEQALEKLTAQRVAAEQRRAATRTPAEMERAEQAAVAATQRRAQALQRETAAVERRAQQAALQAIEGTRFQQLQQRLAARTGRDERPAASFPTLGQAIGTGFITTARFAASGAVLYGVLNTFQQMVRQASILEQIFNQIEAQFTSLGQGNEVAGFKRAIFDIAAATGEQADEVARVAFQMKGAFGDTALAVDQTTAAIEIARITGLSLVEVVDSLTAASKSFGIPIRALGDEALAVQERFGVLAKESLTAFGDVGVVAAQAGLNVHELGGILGGLQQIAGRSGSALAEAIGRILPAIQESSTEILKLYQDVPQLADNFPKIRDLLGSGQTGEVLIQLTRDFARLDQTQQNYIITQLGSRREAQTLIGIFRQHGLILDYIDKQTATAGKQTEYFNKLQETLSQRVARLRREFEQFGQELFNAGLGDVLKDLASIGGDVAHVAGVIAESFAKANEASHGLAIRLLELYAAYRLFLFLRGLTAVTGATGVTGLLAGGAQRVAAIPGIVQGAAQGAAGRYVGQSLMTSVGGGYFGSQVGAAGTRIGAARAAGSGALAAVGLSGPMLTAIAALAVGTVYNNVRAGNETEAEKFRAQIEGATTERLNKIISDRGSLLDRIEEGAQRALRIKTPISEAKLERGQDRYEPIKAEAEAARSLVRPRESVTGFGRFTDPAGELFGAHRESVDEIYKKAAEGNETEIAHIESELARIKKDPKLRVQLENKLKELQDHAAQLEADKKLASGGAIASVKSMEDDYRAGLVTIGQYSTFLANEITKIEARLPALTGEAAVAAQEQLSSLRKTQRDLPSEIAKGLADYRLGQVDLSGGGAEQKVDILSGLLKDPKFTDPAKRADAAKQLVALEQEILRERVSRATSAEEQVRLLTQGVAIDPTARTETLIQTIQAYDIQFTSFLETVAGGADQAAVLLRQVVERSIARSISVTQSLNQILQEQITALKARVAEVAAQLQASTAALDAEINATGPGGGKGAARNEVAAPQQAEIDRINAEIAAKEKQIALNPGTIVPTPAARVKGDASQIKAAKDKARDEAIANQQARFALAKAIAEGDPVEQARIAIEEAQFLIANAKTTADKLNAQAQLVSAQHQLAQAQLQVSDAYRNIDKAMAAAAGDTVRVAQIELDQAREHIASAHSRRDVLGEMAAKAEAISAQANLVAAQINVGQQQTDFLLQMEQITTGQAIAQLEGLLKIPGITQEQTQQLLLKIHQLRKDASKDLQFDIPGEIKLPTLYEVRRLRQSEAQGLGYQDNRQINVQYNVLTAQDNQAALDDLLAVTSGQPRVGGTPKGY